MIRPELYETGQENAWCPGCGNFGIRQAVRQALIELELAPWQVVFVSGIGQAAKGPQYTKCNVFDALHGRAVPSAIGLHLGNHKLKVIVEAGDGDVYSEGTNHLMHAMRRNVGITVLVHNNQVYGLTKGQSSPTSELQFKTGSTPDGTPEPPFNPLAFGVALEAGFVARGYAGHVDRLKDLIRQAIQFPAFSLLDILQPCVVWNRVNTFQWYESRVYYVSDDNGYDSADRSQAFARSLEWGERIPLGVIYRNERPNLESQLPSLRNGPLVEQDVAATRFQGLVEKFR